MNNSLYPLKFHPIYLEKIWGNGARLNKVLGKCSKPNCGESWEISTTVGYISEVSNGFLSGNNLSELIEVYMGDLVGDRIFEKYGLQFPLLFKYIDTAADLSVQVHPGDDTAIGRHNSLGKTEMWYVIDADKGGMINLGFNRDVTKDQFLSFLEEGKLTELLYYDEVSSGDALFVSPGRVHAIGKGVLVAEIQQASDLTYRIYDYNRKDANGNLRELHLDYALDVIDFSCIDRFKIDYEALHNKPTEILRCDYFKVNVLVFSKTVERDYSRTDSFVVYMNIKGSFVIEYDDGSVEVNLGETVLVPASLEYVRLRPLSGEVKLLETSIP